jgi:alpha-N-arabinofuranosidase
LFVGVPGVKNCGTAGYNPNTASFEEYVTQVLSQGVGDLEMFKRVEQPAYIAANAYFNGAQGFGRETGGYTDPDFHPDVKIIDEGDAVYLELNISQEMLEVPAKIVSTATLGTVRIVDAIFDDPQGKPVTLDRDYLGAPRSEKPLVGPLEGLKPGANRIKVWG